jgi:hypothetical protein
MEDQIVSDWRKASYSGNGGGNCVEVATAAAVLVRDSKDSDGLRLTFSAQSWRKFAAKIKGDV